MTKQAVISLECLPKEVLVLRGQKVMPGQVEIDDSMSQIVISLPRLKFSKQVHAFTEQGVAMLSSVLHSERAVQVNIAIMRAFVELRQVLSGHAELARKFAELERRIEGHDGAIRSLFDAIRQLMAPPKKRRREIGFHTVNT